MQDLSVLTCDCFSPRNRVLTLFE